MTIGTFESAFSSGVIEAPIAGTVWALDERCGRPTDRCTRAGALLCRSESRETSVDDESNERVRFLLQNFPWNGIKEHGSPLLASLGVRNVQVPHGVVLNRS